MRDFLLAAEWFLYGLACGFLATPACKFLTKFWQELKIARQEWHKGPDK